MAQQPQSSLMGANADTTVPQQMQAPTQLNPYKMGNQTQQLQAQGMPISQAVTKASDNPANKYAKGGNVKPPTLDQMRQAEAAKIDPKVLQDTMTALQGSKMMNNSTSQNQFNPDLSPDSFHDDLTPSDQEMLGMFDGALQSIKDRNPEVQNKAKGGDIHETVKNMPLKDIIKLIASHPEVAGKLGTMPDPQMRAGGAVGGQNDPDARMKPSPGQKSEAHSHGAGLLNMNVDVPGYADGGSVKKPIPTYSPQYDAGSVDSTAMADGGALEADDISGYDADGTPIMENADGTQQDGDINQLLGRPDSSPVLGTGQTPVTGVSKNAANSLDNTSPQVNMAKGGSDVPPGSLSKEVADDVPANLSEGEFVFSADVVRYYGLRLLNGMMEHARGSLQEMANEGNIRSPGDGKNKPSDAGGNLATFMQDSKPDLNTYSDTGDNGADDQKDDPVTGILKECMGGGMATGGGIAEEDFAKGGGVDSSYGNDTGYGSNNIISSHPKGGSPLMDYAKGGRVTSTAPNLTPKKIGSYIPVGKMKAPAKPAAPDIQKISNAISVVKPNKSGAGMIKNMVPHQSFIGS